MNRSTVLPPIHAWAAPVCLLQHFIGNDVEMRRNFYHCRAVSIKTTHLLCKDCLFGCKYEKAAVISEHHTHTSVFLSIAVQGRRKLVSENPWKFKIYAYKKMPWNCGGPGCPSRPTSGGHAVFSGITQHRHVCHIAQYHNCKQPLITYPESSIYKIFVMFNFANLHDSHIFFLARIALYTVHCTCALGGKVSAKLHFK